MLLFDKLLLGGFGPATAITHPIAGDPSDSAASIIRPAAPAGDNADAAVAIWLTVESHHTRGQIRHHDEVRLPRRCNAGHTSAAQPRGARVCPRALAQPSYA